MAADPDRNPGWNEHPGPRHGAGRGGGESTEGAGQASTGSWELPPATVMDHGHAATENSLPFAFVGHFHTGAEKGNLCPFSNFQGGGTLDEPYNCNT